MTEEVTDRFQRRALAEEMHGQCVTETVRTTESRHLHAGARRPNIERVTDWVDSTGPRGARTRRNSRRSPASPERWRRYATRAAPTSSVSGKAKGAPTLGRGTETTRARH